MDLSGRLLRVPFQDGRSAFRPRATLGHEYRCHPRVHSLPHQSTGGRDIDASFGDLSRDSARVKQPEGIELSVLPVGNKFVTDNLVTPGGGLPDEHQLAGRWLALLPWSSILPVLKCLDAPVPESCY